MPRSSPVSTLPEALLQHVGLPEGSPLLEEALTHPSFANEQRPDKRFDNQRLEFLGDAVLGLVTSELLMARFLWRTRASSR